MIRKNTLIKTKSGEKYIQDIGPEDLILSYNIRTGELCYNKPLLRTITHINGKVAIVNEASLYLAKVSCVLDHNLNTETLIDGEETLTDPAATSLVVVKSDMSAEPMSVSYTTCDDDFYSFMVKDTDMYFANGILMSNGSSNLFIKDQQTFLLEDKNYARSETVLPDSNVDRLFRSFKMGDDIVLNSPYRYLSQGLRDSKKQDMGMTYYQRYYATATFFITNEFIGERTIWISTSE